MNKLHMEKREYPKPCPSCDESFYGPVVFCPFCGVNINESPTALPKPSEQPEPSKQLPAEKISIRKDVITSKKVLIQEGVINYFDLQISLTPFVIDSYPINNGDFKKFIEAGCYENGKVDKDLLKKIWTREGYNWLNQSNAVRKRTFFDEDLDGEWELPVHDVNWYEAVAFCNWRSIMMVDKGILLKKKIPREIYNILLKDLFYQDEHYFRKEVLCGFRLPTEFELIWAKKISQDIIFENDFYEFTSCSDFDLQQLRPIVQNCFDPIPYSSNRRIISTNKYGDKISIEKDVVPLNFNNSFRCVVRPI